LAIAKSDVPLRIEAGPGALAANFAELDMDIDKAGTVTVALRRGKAEVRPVGKTDTRAALPRDKTLTYRGDGSLQPVAATSDTLPRDWPDGWAEYRSIRLDRLVAEANRYAVVPILIDDSASAALEASGRFHVSRTEVFAEGIARLFDLKVERTPHAIHLRRR
jgi:transmembrane sensor